MKRHPPPPVSLPALVLAIAAFAPHTGAAQSPPSSCSSDGQRAPGALPQAPAQIPRVASPARVG